MAIAKLFQDVINSNTKSFEDVDGGTGFNFMKLEVGYTFAYKGNARETWTYQGIIKGDVISGYSVWTKKGSKYIFILPVIFGQFGWFSGVEKTKKTLADVSLLTGSDIQKHILSNRWVGV